MKRLQEVAAAFEKDFPLVLRDKVRAGARAGA